MDHWIYKERKEREKTKHTGKETYREREIQKYKKKKRDIEN